MTSRDTRTSMPTIIGVNIASAVAAPPDAARFAGDGEILVIFDRYVYRHVGPGRIAGFETFRLED